MKPFDEVFSIKQQNEKFIIYSLKMENTKELAATFDEYFFSNEVLFKHCNYLYKTRSFIENKQNYTTLYRELEKYIDSEFLDDEFMLSATSSSDYEKIRQDKVGKLGEYFLSIVLSEYFSFDCIIPKINLLTSNNMSVHGVDALFYSEKDKTLVFGESKFTQKIDTGIKLANISLSNYKNRIEDEYKLVFSRDKLQCLNVIKEKYKEAIETSINFSEFVEVAKINTILIPVFITHGEELCESDIISRLGRITKNNFSLKGISSIKYLFISLPIIEKKSFVKELTICITNRLENYGKNRNDS